MSGVGSQGTASDAPRARSPKAAGTWVGSLIFAVFLLFLIFYAAQAAYQDRWARFAGTAVSILALVVVSTGGVKRLRRGLRGRKPPA
jgi:hypothetical protein